MWRSSNVRRISLAVAKQQQHGLRQQSKNVWVRNIHNSTPMMGGKKEEEPLPPSFVEQYKLTDPTRYVPLTVGGLGLSSMIGLYHFDAESQLLALWVLFCGTVYSRGGPIISEYFDETIRQIETEHKALEEEEIEAVKLTAEAHRRQTAVFEDISGLFAAQNEVMDGIVGSAKQRLAHAVRGEFLKKLDTVVNMESQVAEEARKHLVNNATQAVKKAFASDNLKKSALDAALAALGDPKGAKPDSTVGDLYTKYFADVDSKVKAQNGKEFEITAEQAKEIQETCESIARRDRIPEMDLGISTKVVFKA